MYDYRQMLRGLIVSKYKINHLGYDVDDLTNEVETHLWEKVLKKSGDPGYAYVAAKNKLIDLHRKDKKELIAKQLLSPLLPTESNTDIEREMFSREAISFLHGKLDGDQWWLLITAFKNGFRIREMWRTAGGSLSYTGYKVRVHRLVAYCRKVLRKAGIYRPVGKTINKLEV